MALSENGNTAVIGAHQQGNGVGAAWIATRSAGTWTLGSAPLPATGVAADSAWLGASVAISANGNLVVVGGPVDGGGVGAVWTFARDGSGNWAQQGSKLVSPNTSLAPKFGYSVSLSGAGDRMVIGAPGFPFMEGEVDYRRGAAYVYAASGASWTLEATLDAPSGAGADQADDDASQGSSVAISKDGSTVVIGGQYDESDRGSAWVYSRSGATWSGPHELGSEFQDYANAGVAVALSDDGSEALVGGSYEPPLGAAKLYNHSSGTWVLEASLTSDDGTAPAGQGGQGISVALSGDGLTALVGDATANDFPIAGQAWLYERTGSSWPSVGQKLVGTGASTSECEQGFSVALSSDGYTAVSGAPLEDNQTGAFWVFTHDISDSWVEIALDCPGLFFVDDGYTVRASLNRNPSGKTPSFIWSASPANVVEISGGMDQPVASVKTKTPMGKTIFVLATAFPAEICVDVTLGGVVAHKCMNILVRKHTAQSNVMAAIASLNCTRQVPPRIRSIPGELIHPVGPGGPGMYSVRDLQRIESLATRLARDARTAQQEAKRPAKGRIAARK